MIKYISITEAALDIALVSGLFPTNSNLPCTNDSIAAIEICEDVVGFRAINEQNPLIFCLIGAEWIDLLRACGGTPSEIFQRVARVLKGLRSPPVHFPRKWLEYHHRNLVTFFALPHDDDGLRWIVELGGSEKYAVFNFLTSRGEEVDLEDFVPNDLNSIITACKVKLGEKYISVDHDNKSAAIIQEVDLQVIGSNSVVEGRTFEDWERLITLRQLQIIQTDINESIRIVGPAGSGKTLSLCMRTLQISRDAGVIAQGKRVLVATHSWAMSERIDGILTTLNSGVSPQGVTVFPLLSLLELHAGHIGQRRTEIIGDDSTDGRMKSLEIIANVLSKIDAKMFLDISDNLLSGLSAKIDSRSRIDLVINLYEEISGVLTASGVAPDDPTATQDYLMAKREDWMPPFITVADRAFAVEVYKGFIQSLVDRGAITTDQFIIDSIRILETFTWRMRKETDGYDYIVIDELQLFDPQERSALELLGRSRKGVPFITAEDPSQGVFAALNGRRANVDNAPVYLDTIHRFNDGIFAFINFLYQKFPLNAVPLKIGDRRGAGDGRPTLHLCKNEKVARSFTTNCINQIASGMSGEQRLCVVSLADTDEQLLADLEKSGISITNLESFDDVEQLSYRKRSVVISPWQFIGGTQFSHVVVLASGASSQSSQFGRLREMIAVYLSCSRAANTLKIVCAEYIPPIISEAVEQGFLKEINIG